MQDWKGQNGDSQGTSSSSRGWVWTNNDDLQQSNPATLDRSLFHIAIFCCLCGCCYLYEREGFHWSQEETKWLVFKIKMVAGQFLNYLLGESCQEIKCICFRILNNPLCGLNNLKYAISFAILLLSLFC